MQARDSAAFQNINPLFNQAKKDDEIMSLIIKELQTELQQLRQQNEILKKQLELKDELLDKKSTQIISYASENIQYEKEIEKLKKELSIYKQLHLEDHLFIPTTDSSNDNLSKKNKRARSKSKSTKSHKKSNPKRKATKLKQKARSYDQKNSALGYMEIDSIDEQTALSFSEDAKQIEKLASPQSSPDLSALSPQETELPYFMPSISTNLSGCSDLSAQACKLSLPPSGIKTALNGVIMDHVHMRGMRGQQMDVDDEEEEDNGYDSPLGPSPAKRLEFKDSNPPPFLPKKPLLRILSPIAEHNANEVEELNSFTLDGTRSDISSTNVTPIPNDIDNDSDTKMDMDTPVTSPELRLRNSDANSNIGDEWVGCMAEIESDALYVGQRMSIDQIALNDFQSDEESDGSAADTERMLVRALYSATNFKRFSEDEDNESENDAKKQSDREDLISYVSDNTHIYMDLNMDYMAYRNSMDYIKEEDDNNNYKNHKRLSKSLSALSDGYNTLMEMEMEFNKKVKPPPPMAPTTELTREFTEKSFDTFTGCDKIVKAPFQLNLCIAN